MFRFLNVLCVRNGLTMEKERSVKAVKTYMRSTRKEIVLIVQEYCQNARVHMIILNPRA